MARRAKPAKARRPLARTSSTDEAGKVEDLEKRLGEALEREAGAVHREAEALELLQARNSDLSEALAQQTATGEILSVISSSTTDVQPVFDAIVRSAQALTAPATSAVFIVAGEEIAVAITAADSVSPEDMAAWRAHYPRVPTPDTVMGRVILEGQAVQAEDLETDPRYQTAPGRLLAVRSILGVPMLRDGHTIGAIAVWRREVKPFSDKQIELLQTFAAQAVIAIENVRLFKELEARNRDLTTALDQQTATSEILRSISNSLTDAQPVFNTIVQSGLRLLGGYSATMMLLRNDDRLDLVAYTSTGAEADSALVDAFPMPLRRIPPGERAIHELRAHAVEDVEIAPDVSDVMRETGRARGWRSNLFVPMIRDAAALGLISITRREPGPFAADQIALLEIFAAQAVIAIENVRLFTELQEKNRALAEAHAQVTEALEHQTATSEILRTISQAQTDARPVFEAIADSVMRLFRAWSALVFGYDGEFLRLTAARGGLPGSSDSLLARLGAPYGPTDDSPALRTVRTRTVQHIVDVEALDPSWNPRFREEATARGFRSLVQAPMLHEGDVVGVIAVTRAQPGGFTPAEIALLKTFADQAVIAIENVRLFTELQTRNLEIADKSRQLEVASQHKSEFLANMSHELRTPLNAVIGFSEVLGERMFGELNDKQAEYVQDINVSGTHLLSLINDILDLSKIEAGRMELELADFHLPQAIENALVLVRERALRRGITLEQSIDPGLGEMQGDERKIKQVLLNLLSNAIKFTPEGGRVGVRAAPVDEHVEVAVSDTGVGIAPEDQVAVFEEFRQVGAAEKKAEGTGLGLALARKFIELHGGRIWVQSQVGVGSTFTFTIPVRHGD